MRTILQLVPQTIAGSVATEALANTVVSSLAIDSRRVETGAMFFAIRGAKSDGTAYIDEAVRRGAACVVVEGGELPLASVPVVGVESVRRAISFAASQWYDAPSEKLYAVGITGTNGKSSTAWIIASILAELGTPAALVGTLGKAILGSAVGNATAAGWQALDNTTPDPLEIHSFLADAVQQGARATVLEATSQGIAQSRTADIQWDAAVFTNLTRDHLDLHGSLEAYAELKTRLFTEELQRSTKSSKIAVVNYADPVGRAILESLPSHVTGLRYSIEGADADAVVTDIVTGMQRTTFSARVLGHQLSIETRLIGTYNVENCLAALTVLIGCGYVPQRIVEALSVIPPVPGRLELVADAPVHVFVDYAHTPDALSSVLQSLRAFAPGKIVTVFGCGGDRDRGKRPLMAQAVAELSDQIVVTSDNPRTEDPQRIVEDIIPGIPAGTGYNAIVDRADAIRFAILNARPDDCVLIAGKGHEDYQEVNGVKRQFSDQQVSRSVLVERFG